MSKCKPQLSDVGVAKVAAQLALPSGYAWRRSTNAVAAAGPSGTDVSGTATVLPASQRCTDQLGSIYKVKVVIDRYPRPFLSQ